MGERERDTAGSRQREAIRRVRSKGVCVCVHVRRVAGGAAMVVLSVMRIAAAATNQRDARRDKQLLRRSATFSGAHRFCRPLCGVFRWCECVWFVEVWLLVDA